MYLDRFRAKSIRCIQGADVNFQPGRKDKAGWSVFLGPSASGKTTLLQAIAATILGPANVLVMLRMLPRLVREGQEKGDTDVWLSGVEGEDGRGPRDLDGFVHLGVTWGSQGGAYPRLSQGKNGLASTQFGEGAALGAQPRGWCFAAYGAGRHAGQPTAFAGDLMSGPPRRAAAVTLFRADASLAAAETWAMKAKWDALRHRVLKALLSDGLLSRDGAHTAVDFLPAGVAVSRPEGRVFLGSLGAAYDALALLVVDIVRQMAAFYGDDFMGGLDWHPSDDGKVEVPHSGVVLIDDIDLHLDSTLQERVGPWLKAHFPRVQFIVTAKSLDVCAAADAGGVFVFTEPGVLRPVSREDLLAVTNRRCPPRTSAHSPEDQSDKTRR
jgi:energy-coupling factor transporter ATP-binding protein EcfA2